MLPATDDSILQGQTAGSTPGGHLRVRNPRTVRRRSVCADLRNDYADPDRNDPRIRLTRTGEHDGDGERDLGGRQNPQIQQLGDFQS